MGLVLTHEIEGGRHRIVASSTSPDGTVLGEWEGPWTYDNWVAQLIIDSPGGPQVYIAVTKDWSITAGWSSNTRHAIEPGKIYRLEEVED